MVVSVAALIWLLASPQDSVLSDAALTKKVTYSTVAARLENLLPDLAKTAGVQMVADSATKDEVIVAQVRDMPLKDLMARIAEVSGAAWEMDKDGYHLRRSSALQRKQEEDERDRIVALVGAEVDRIGKELGNAKAWDQAQATRFVTDFHRNAEDYLASNGARQDLYREIERLNKTCPLNQLGPRAFAALDPKVLASLQRGDRVVFSSRPTRMQQPLPRAATAFLNQFLVQRAMIARAAREVNDAPGSELASWMTWLPTTPDAVASKMLVIGQRKEYLNVEVCLYDATGASMAGGSHTMLIAMRGEGSMPPLPDAEVEYSETTKRMVAAIKAARPTDSGAAKDTYVLPADIMDQVCNPDRTDPLSTLPTDMVVSLAKAMGAKDIVAVVPDRLLALRAAAASKPTVSSAYRQLAASSDMKVEVRDGCLIVKYQWPTEQRMQRVDRRALKDLFASYRSQGLLRLDVAASFVSRCSGLEDPGRSPLVASYPDSVLRLQFQFIASSPDGLPLYGSLGETQRLLLRQGRALAIATLSSQQRALLHRTIFSDRLSANADPTAATNLGWLPSALRSEPTEVFPDGLPSTTTISMASKMTNGLFPVGQIAYSPWQPALMARLFLHLEQPDTHLAPLSEVAPKLFRPGRQLDLDLWVRFMPGASRMWRLRDQQWVPLSPGMTPASLPPEYVQEVQKELRALKELEAQRKRAGG